MTSDWRVVPIPLGKFSCTRCALAYRDPTLPSGAEFDRDYELYAHPPGGIAERRRQDAYAAWIASIVEPPSRVLDVGCGNGSLLLALRERWAHAELTGCDPSPAGVRFAEAAGLIVWSGTVADQSPERPADLVLSVNVIEHTTDPQAFVRALSRTVTDDGQLVIICPDGARPGVELLIADHLSSFTSDHLEAMLRVAGLTVRTWGRAPRELGPFQMVVASRKADAASSTTSDASELLQARRSYLRAWQQLDASLTSRLPSQVVCFGAGEAAGLLRAYAPGGWARVTVCATDGGGVMFGDRPHIVLADVPKDATVLVGVRPQDQLAVAERLVPRVAHVVTWYDLVPSDDAG